jgi:hypothetical protein
VNAALPLVIDATLALLPTLPGWSTVSVYDGPQVVGDTPREYVTVGFVEGEDFGGTFEPIAGPRGCARGGRVAAVGGRVLDR